jgi:hypothetical protein
VPLSDRMAYFEVKQWMTSQEIFMGKKKFFLARTRFLKKRMGLDSSSACYEVHAYSVESS